MTKIIMDGIKARLPKLVERAKTTRAAAIRLHCLECMGDMQAEVTACSITTCALHPFRRGNFKLGQTGFEGEA